jgi:hypothetical protein
MVRITLIAVLFSITLTCNQKIEAQQIKSKKQNVVSKLVTTAEGKTYLEVDGKPFLYNSVQAWLPADGNYEIFMRKTHDVGYNIFTLWFPWRSIEPQKGKMDWSVLDKVIKQAEKFNMRLDIVWGGSNFCGGLDKRFAPDFILNDSSFFVKDENGSVEEVKKYDMGMCHVANYSNKKLLEIESTTIRTMMNYLYKRDTSHRVVIFQIENEPNLMEWSLQDKKVILNYVNALGKVIKTSPYSIVTRVNLASKNYEPLIDSLEYIDCHGLDIYTEELDVLHSTVKFKTKMPHVAENAAYENSSTLIAEALANGGFYNIYRLDFDKIWNKPGIYGDDWIYLHQTFDIQLFNRALNKISVQVAESSAKNMICFNTATKMPASDYSEIKELNGFKIGFQSLNSWQDQGVGFVLNYKGDYYLIADNKCTFYFPVDVKAETGSFNDQGKWMATSTKSITKVNDGRFELKYNFYECIRIYK